jgi:hypothetical protein
MYKNDIRAAHEPMITAVTLVAIPAIAPLERPEDESSSSSDGSDDWAGSVAEGSVGGRSDVVEETSVLLAVVLVGALEVAVELVVIDEA